MSTATRIATAILNGFEAAIEDHNRITMGARARFEKTLWDEVKTSQTARANAYRDGIKRAQQKLERLADPQLQHREFWVEVKSAFLDMVEDHDNANICKTFYNSVFSHWFNFDQSVDQCLFVEDDSPKAHSVSTKVFNRFKFKSTADELITRILDRYEFNIDWLNQDEDVNNIINVITKEVLRPQNLSFSDIEIQVLKAPFFRNKGAYLIGRILTSDTIIPLILPISNLNAENLFVDAAITSHKDASVIFSFTRSYFMVDARIPREYVNFLSTLMPHKLRSELYTSIGFIKHGKTEFVRAFNDFANQSEHKLIIAPGIKGMVMSVFTLPDFDVVFKVIKDSFQPPKKVTHEQVREKYRLVSRHDRVGRMADTQEFFNFRFKRALFDQKTLDELVKVAPSQILDDGMFVIIKHLYIERKVIPLNLYLQNESRECCRAAIIEYGSAIKEIAAANIFPGDMLFKNFGVTRHGRVIFYDYDEICFLTECHFRVIPKPRNSRDEMAAEPWYSIEEHDVFPEEFAYFFSGIANARKDFNSAHKELYLASYWKSIQADILEGKSHYVYPFDQSLRFYPERSVR